MSDDLRDAVLAAIAAAPLAWSTPAGLALALGSDPGATEDLLCDLDLAGLVSVWADGPEGEPVVTLSPLAAARLGVRLVGDGPDALRWAPAGEPDPPPPRASGAGGDPAPAPAGLVDPGPGPAWHAAHAENAPRRVSRGGELPRPTLILGVGHTPWPGPGAAPARPCPVCRGRGLGPSAFCLLCERWGLDHLLPKRPARPPDPRKLARQAEEDRRTRKERRKARYGGR